MDPGQLAKLTMLAGLIVDKALARFIVTWYDGVKKLHCGCSSCMEFDVDRSAKTPPMTPISVSGHFESPIVAAPPPLPPPTIPSSEEAMVQLAPIGRRKSVTENLVTLASPPGSD